MLLQITFVFWLLLQGLDLYFFKVFKFFSRQSKYPIVFDESTLNEEYKIFIVEYMSVTVQLLATCTNKFKI